jgi:hypothetical protein
VKPVELIECVSNRPEVEKVQPIVKLREVSTAGVFEEDRNLNELHKPE